MALSLTIDGKQVSAEPGESLLDVALRNGAEIPYLCHYPKIKPYGACRLCLVEVTKGGRKKITTSCNYEVLDGIEVRTNTDEVRAHRKMVLELLVGLAPEATRVKGLARAYGVKDSGRFRPLPPPADRDNCILCGLCSRICGEVVGAHAITFSGRGDRKGLEVPYRDRIADSCIGCGACAWICPTGAIEMESIAVDVLRERPATDRPCRYALMGMMPGAVCPNNYDCRLCEVDQRFFETCRPLHPVFAVRGVVVPAGWEE